MQSMDLWLKRVCDLRDDIVLLMRDIPEEVEFTESAELVADLQTIQARVEKIIEEH